ncbi:MAG: HlyD family efflux transporter periplasmic adaptor subunit [Ethanoligenens sp.]
MGMNKSLKWLLRVGLSLFLLAYVGFQAYRMLYHPIRTQRVTLATVQDTVTADAIALHDETVLKGGTSGVIDYTRTDGERVSKGGTVANIYPTEQDAQNQQALQKLQDKITQLQNLGDSGSASVTDVSVLDAALREDFLKLADATSGSNLDGLSDAGANLLDYLNRKQLATGAVSDFNGTIAVLQKQADALKAKIGAVGQPLTSPLAGYFVKTADGYEGAYDVSNIASIKPADVQKLLTEKVTPPTDAAGKIVSEFEWYVVALLSPDEAHRLSESAQVNLRFVLSSEDAIPATVLALNPSGNQYAAVFQCSSMTEKLAAVRCQSVRVIIGSYTGLRVDNQYISVVKGKKGVFVQDGNTARFRTIVPVYSGNGYTVSSVDSTDAGRLQVYDAMITNRDDLHDGELLQ